MYTLNTSIPHVRTLPMTGLNFEEAEIVCRS